MPTKMKLLSSFATIYNQRQEMSRKKNNEKNYAQINQSIQRALWRMWL
tara:strand:- start:1302 stop:1445 length:144 start_codon:yes stop_codon:yes gene_type:complete